MQKMHEMEQLANVQGLPTDRNTLNKLMALNSGLNNPINNNHNMVNRGALSGSAQAALALTNYQNLLMRQNSMNSSPSSLQREGSSSFNNSNQSPSSALQGAASALIPGSMQNTPVSGFPSPHLPPPQQQQQQHLQQRSLSANILQQNHSQGPQGNQALQQRMIQQLLMSNHNGAMQPQSLGGPNANGSLAKNGLGFGGQSPTITGGSVNVSGNNGPVSRSNSFKAASNSDSSAAGGNNGFNQRSSSDMPQNLHLQDVVQDIANEFTDNPFFNSDLDDNMGFGWKA